jgi:predicted secreted protein
LGIAGSIILFLLIWWLLLFIVLPLNISDTAEKIVEGGNDTGAPSNPQIFKKFLITTIISIILWFIIYMFLRDQGLLLYILDVFYSNEVK